MVTFYYVADYRGRYRLFSSEPAEPPPVKPSKAKEVWDKARKKLTLLPQRVLRQEQAFARCLRIEEPSVRLLHGCPEATRLESRFHFFLFRQRSRRVALLAAEGLVLPVTALTMPLPGPNITFYALALIVITHWQSLRGIRRLIRKKHEFEYSPLLGEWEKAVAAGDESAFPALLERIETELAVAGARKVLWK